jgi:hypothetical protein
VKRELERIEIPGEHDARERTWSLVAAAFAERAAVEHSARMLRPALAIAVIVAALAAVLSPPGRAVLDEIRAKVGVDRAQPALFSLPAQGRVLVASDAGVWVVQADGSKRLLGPYREASWSPFGRFVVAARANELAALEPDGDVRWTLSRRDVRSPRWTGTDTDTRIAYIDGTGLRVVAGDGTGDRLLVARAQGPAAWRPGSTFELAFVDPRGRVALLDTATGKTLWHGTHDGRVVGLGWSSDGRRLVAARADALNDVAVYAPDGALFTGFRANGAVVTAAETRPGTHAQAVAVYRSGSSRLLLPGVRGASSLSGPGSFETLTWSPNARWLLVSWPAADQWVFVRADGKRIRAVSNVSDQFRSRTFPRVQGWCCSP